MSTGSDFADYRKWACEEIVKLKAENVKLRERIAFEASLNAELKEKIEHKTNSGN